MEAAVKVIAKGSNATKYNPRIATLAKNIALIAQSYCNMVDAIKRLLLAKEKQKGSSSMLIRIYIYTARNDWFSPCC